MVKKNKKDEGKKETNGKQRRKDNLAHKVVKNMPRIEKKEKKGKKAKNTPKKTNTQKGRRNQTMGKRKQVVMERKERQAPVKTSRTAKRRKKQPRR